MLWSQGHITKQMYVKGAVWKPDVWSVAVLTDLENELNSKVESIARENTPPGHSLIVQMKRGKQNLESMVFFVVIQNQPNGRKL